MRQTPELVNSEFDDDKNAVPPDADEPDDFDDFSPMPADDAAWDEFLADDDERDPPPEHGDFWDDVPFDD